MVLLVLAGTVQAAGVHRWVDDQGRVHYTDRPPDPGTETEQLRIAPAPAEDPELSARREKQRRFLDAIAEERARERADAEARRKEERRRAKNCSRIKRSVAQFEGGGVLYIQEENGDRHYLDEDERASTLEVLRRQQRQWCGR